MDPILEPQQSSVPKTKKRHYSRKRQKVVKNQSSEPPPVTGKKLGTVGCGVCNLSDARYRTQSLFLSFVPCIPMGILIHVYCCLVSDTNVPNVDYRTVLYHAGKIIKGHVQL
jgi:hypothetical protein